MDRRSVTKRLILCAGLAALAAPLRAGEAEWRSSENHKYVIQVPASWRSGAAVPGLTPKGIVHAFSLAPVPRTFVLDVGAENALDKAAASAEAYFAKARKLAGGPPALRVQLPDKSMFEYFRSTVAVKGLTGFRVQGVLYKYVQRYYLTFSSTRGYPGDKEWKDALKVLATLDNDEPAADGWEHAFLRKVQDSSGQGDRDTVTALKYVSAVRPDGTEVSFYDIAIFGCKNFVGNLYLFNEDRTAHCWIATMEDYKTILKRVDPKYLMDNHPYFPDCPEAMKLERACDVAKVRYF